MKWRGRRAEDNNNNALVSKENCIESLCVVGAIVVRKWNQIEVEISTDTLKDSK